VKFTNRHFRINKLIFKSDSRLAQAIFDPDHQLAILTDTLFYSVSEVTELISQLPYQSAGEKALEMYQQAVDLKLTEPRPWFKLGLTLFDGGYYPESFEAFKKLSELKPEDLILFTAFVWLGHLKDLLNEREAAVKYYQATLKHDTGKTMHHDQYGLKINREWVEERLKTPFAWGKK